MTSSVLFLLPLPPLTNQQVVIIQARVPEIQNIYIMNIDDGILVEAVRSRREVFDKGHPGWKNAAIKDAAWAAIGEAVSGRLCSYEIRLGSLLLGLHRVFTCSAAPAADCSARWHTLRERYN